VKRLAHSLQSLLSKTFLCQQIRKQIFFQIITALAAPVPIKNPKKTAIPVPGVCDFFEPLLGVQQNRYTILIKIPNAAFMSIYAKRAYSPKIFDNRFRFFKFGQIWVFGESQIFGNLLVG
jgi:hypothetical protein